MAANRFTERGVRAESDGLHEVFDFEDGFFRVPDEPEDDGVDVDGNSVAREGGFGVYRREADALIDVAAQAVNDGNDEEDARAPQSSVAAEAQHSNALPLVDDLDGVEKIEADENAGNGEGDVPGERCGQESCSNNDGKDC